MKKLNINEHDSRKELATIQNITSKLQIKKRKFI